MSEEANQKETPATLEHQSFDDILKALVGKTVTIVNPESYEVAPMGFKLSEGYYRAKLTAIGSDYIQMVTQIERKKGSPEMVKQWIPTARVKRISLLKGEGILHL